MAAGPFVSPHLAVFNFLNATNLLSANTSNFRAALVASTWTPNNSTDEVWADMSAHEIADGNGYDTGGIALTGVALTHSSGTIKFTCTAPVWTADAGNIPAWRRMVVYYLGSLNGKTNPVVAHCLGDATPADIPATTNGNTLTVTPSASGIISASFAY